MDADLRKKFIRSVKKLYEKMDYSDISLSMILTDVGASKGAMYWYFESKEALFEAAFDECYNTVVNATNSFDRTDMSPIQILKCRLHAIAKVAENDPQCIIMLNKYLAWMTRETGIEHYPYGQFRADVEDLINQGIENGDFKPLPISFIRYFVFWINKGIIDYLMEHPGEFSDEETHFLIDQMFSVLLDA